MVLEQQTCPCGTSKDYAECCGPVLAGQRAASTAEALMRSRYTAFVRGNDAYLAASWHSQTRPDDASAPTGIDWRRLRIRDTQGGGPDDETVVVEYIDHIRNSVGICVFIH